MNQLLEEVKHISTGSEIKKQRRSNLAKELLEISMKMSSDEKELFKRASEIISQKKHMFNTKKEIRDLSNKLVSIMISHQDVITNKLIMMSEQNCVFDNETDNVIASFVRTTITLSEYNHHHVLYAFITNIDKKRFIVKFGYTNDIVTRCGTLESEYKAKFYLIGIKIIASEQDEKEFHKILKKVYPSLIYNHSIKGINKKELYHFDNRLMEEHKKFESNGMSDEYWKYKTADTTLSVEKEKNEQLMKEIELTRMKTKQTEAEIKLSETKRREIRLQIKLLQLQKIE